MTTIWLQSVTAGVVLRWLPAVFLGRVRVRYDEHHATPAALRLLSRLNSLGFAPAGLDFNRLDENDHGLLYRMQDDLLASMGRYVEETLKGEPLWLRQAVHFRLRERLEWTLVFLTSAGHAARRHDGPHAFVIDADPADVSIVELFASRGVDVRRSCRGRKSLKPYLFPLQLAGALAVARFSRGGDEGNAAGERPAVWCEYMPPTTLDYTFWRGALKERAAYELVYYLDRPDARMSPKTSAEIERHGFLWIDLHSVELLRRAAVSWGRWLGIGAGCFSRGRLPFWLKITVFECLAWREAYERVFTRFNVKLLIQHDDRGWKQAVQAGALETSGGIMIGYHWSNIPYCLKEWFLNSQHVYFAWGSISREALEKKGTACRRILPSGLWLESDETMPPEAAAVRARSRFTLCLFDSSVSYDIWQSPATLSEFYRRVLALAKRNPGWGILIKCKHEDFDGYESALPGGRALADDVRGLRAEGRLTVLSPLLSPLTAARGADLSVCYTMNTAGVIAALRGSRAVHWDCVGLRHPFRRDTTQKVLYSTLDLMEEAILSAAGGDLSVGDLTPWAKRLDYFRDRKAAARVAGYIEDYLGLRSSHGATAAADQAAANYLERNGVSADYFANDFWAETD